MINIKQKLNNVSVRFITEIFFMGKSITIITNENKKIFSDILY